MNMLLTSSYIQCFIAKHHLKNHVVPCIQYLPRWMWFLSTGWSGYPASLSGSRWWGTRRHPGCKYFIILYAQEVLTYLYNMMLLGKDEDPDPLIFGLPDPDTTCNNGYIKLFSYWKKHKPELISSSIISIF